ncbi:HD domain-containing protein [Spirochaeta lutea]|uniref:HD/PDEase domain-containing protein n=1 Tax=Spirochaeta lutea TaxID=1480694 RepID=A0A098QY19_9SPIO|nr:HD domain-containing protein [Spirochaeta lutea]KGE71342.1 hypothetical protein DC28_11050 [Spirochaeta lutea]
MNHELRSHIENDYNLPIRDPIWHHIYLSPGLNKIIQSRPFQQLSRIKQLGPAYLVYPGATHSRFNHSLGVFHIAMRILQRILLRPSCPPLTLEGGKAFLTAALVHDLGHFPYTHSLKELPLKDHEVLTGEIVLSQPLSDIITREIGTSPEYVADIVDTSRHSSRDEILFFRNILSSPLDPDKLDYLTRDAFFCGVPYGTQDIDYILSRIHPAGYSGITLEEQGASSIEHLLFSKYLMYRSVYWHRQVRIATGMIKKALFLGLTNAIISPEDLYNLDDEGFFATLNTREGFIPFGLIESVHRGELYTIVVDRPFDPGSQGHHHLEDLVYREQFEQRIMEWLRNHTGLQVQPEEVVLDIPESISFEVDLPILRRDSTTAPYLETRTVFTPRVVNDFTQTLRYIRVALSPRVAQALTTPLPFDDLLTQLA